MGNVTERGYLKKLEWGIEERDKGNDGNAGNQSGNDENAENSGGNYFSN